MGAASAAAQALDRHSPTTYLYSLTVGYRAKMELWKWVLLMGSTSLTSAPSTSSPSTGVELRARDKAQQVLLDEVLKDHEQELSGG